MAMLRGALGVIVGWVVWIVVFFTAARLVYLVWPAYAAGAQSWIDSQTYAFAPAGSVANALLWILAEVAAGWVAVAIARRREAGWVLAALLMGYMCFMHLYYVWPNFPWWYNLAVALPSGAAVLFGARLAAPRFAQRSAMA